jgi:hypothetical protein
LAGGVRWAGQDAIFFALGSALIAFITFVTPADGVPLWDLAELFANLLYAPGDYIWLMVTLSSTLLPTLLHLSIAALTLALQYPAWCNIPHGGAILLPIFWRGVHRAGRPPFFPAFAFAP